MFTANMDGCSFGYGSKTGTGEVLVGHANAADVGVEAAEQEGGTVPKGRIGQKDAQYLLLQKKMMPDSLHVVHPYFYGDPFHGADANSDTNIYKYAATVFGLRKATGWEFYMQRRVVTTDGHYLLTDTVRI